MDEVGSSDDEDYVPSEEGNDSEQDEKSEQERDVEEHPQPSTSVKQSDKDNRHSSEETKESDDERKRRLDALFDDFIGASSSSATDSMSAEPTSSTLSSEVKRKEAIEAEANRATSETKTITEIFDFAGEEVRIQRTVPKSDHKGYAPVEANISKNKRVAGGLGDAVKLLSKKPKMSVLEKTQHDWTTFKAESGIHDELQSHNRGRHGYVEKMAFLNRADLRQFERERDARNANRAKK